MRRRVFLGWLALVVTACGSSSGGDSPATDSTIDDVVETGTGCGAGTLIAGDGHCEPAGVPPSSCAAGFASDGNGGCDVVLPADACPAGQLALPGETSCHEVAPCGAGAWGDVPVDASTQYVDASFAGATSDGSAKAPWKTIGDAIKAATPKAIVAVAAGRYVEDVHLGGVGGKPVRLWGICPSRVEIAGSVATGAAVSIGGGANGAEVHDVALTGAGGGVFVTGPTDVVVDRVWIHDTAERGVQVQFATTPSSLTVSHSLIEGTHHTGASSFGASLTVDSSVLRDVQPQTDGTFGKGIAVRAYGGLRATLTVHSSIVERCHEIGIDLEGSDGSIDGTLVRDTRPRVSDGMYGRGINAWAKDADRSSLQLRTSIVQGSHEFGVFVAGSDATLETIVVRDTLPRAADDMGGIGLEIQRSLETDGRSTASVTASLVASNVGVGIAVLDADATLSGVFTRDTKPGHNGGQGDGIALLGTATVSVVGSRVESSARTGLADFGGNVSIGTSLFECNAIPLDQESLDGATSAFTDTGGNQCGCAGTSSICQILSAGLAPPTSLGPS